VKFTSHLLFLPDGRPTTHIFMVWFLYRATVLDPRHNIILVNGFRHNSNLFIGAKHSINLITNHRYKIKLLICSGHNINLVAGPRHILSLFFDHRHNIHFFTDLVCNRLHLWSSGQSFWLQIQRSRIRFPALPDFLRSEGSGTGSTQPPEDNWGSTWMKK
jgi:hypothetical protein